MGHQKQFILEVSESLFLGSPAENEIIFFCCYLVNALVQVLGEVNAKRRLNIKDFIRAAPMRENREGALKVQEGCLTTMLIQQSEAEKGRLGSTPSAIYGRFGRLLGVLEPNQMPGMSWLLGVGLLDCSS